jgi:ABC-type transporter Mla subunit MlaD
MTTTQTGAKQNQQADAEAVFLAPRVVDETALRVFGDRLRELVERAEGARESLSGVSGQSAETIKSLEAMTHTQTRRAREIREALDRAAGVVERLDAARKGAAKEAERLSGFEKRSAGQLAALTEASAGVVERAETARAALDAAVREAEERAKGAGLEKIDAALERLVTATESARTERDALESAMKASAEAVRSAAQAADEARGLREQTDALLSAMRGTILECAEARDSADARLEALRSLVARTTSELESAEARVGSLAAEAAKLEQTAPGAGIDETALMRRIEAQIATHVREQIGEQIETRVGKALARHDRSEPAGAEVSEQLGEVRRSLEMLSGVTLEMAQRAQQAAAPIPAMAPATAGLEMASTPGTELGAAIEPDAEPKPRFERAAPAKPVRVRRASAPPVGASGELGDPARLRTLWAWSEGRGATLGA